LGSIALPRHYTNHPSFYPKIFTPILHWIDGKQGAPPKPLPYPYGSRGPKELNEFIEKYNYKRADKG
jgi:hypothetical protein